MATILDQAKDRFEALRDRAQRLQKTRAYRALRGAPTPLRPWIGALEAALTVERRRLERGYRKQTKALTHELAKARIEAERASKANTEHATPKRAGALGNMVLLAGAAYAAYRLLSRERRGTERPAVSHEPLERERTPTATR